MDSQQIQQALPIDDSDLIAELFGSGDENIAVIQDETGTQISLHHDSLLITGEEQAVQTAAAVIRRLLILLKKRERIDRSRIRYAIELAAEGATS